MLHVQQPEVLRVSGLSALAGAVSGGCAFLFAQAPAAAVTLDDLKGLSVQTRATYNMRIRREQGEFSPQATHVMKFRISDEGRIVGETVRTTTTPRGPRSRSHKMNARIGKPGDSPAGGEGLWLIDGDKLVLLRTFDTGGFKAEIEFKGTGAAMTCTYRAPFVREEGKAGIRRQSVVGGPVTILSATQTSSDCKVSR
ncbi:MAG: hypothetical protein ACOY5F_01420 [Pseudomonadota bacterium]